ncbi:MAG: phenylalanine--tRNA ligase subunit beta [Gemmatimonadetes bacterium]|nr:phenylalanine--tRNA ligase subunit beta [Gemmatimonadota bacterium]
MKVSYRWVRDVAPGIGLTPEEAMERLALRGAPVEEVVDLAAGLEDVVIGRVLEARPHPNADRLTLCRVAGPDGEVPVVCGAPVVVPGAFYPFAPVGAVLPGGFRIGKRKIRGEYSEGMLCSESELGLGSDHAGIMLLDGEYETGSPFAAATGLDDVRLDVEVTPNRGDLLSHVGIARELHPDGQGGIVLPPFPSGAAQDGEPAETPGGLDASFARGTSESASAGVGIRIEDSDLCSRYLGAVIRGVSVGPSPRWLADRLRAAGSRPINNVVDATNYVMLELGQPLHAFDLDRLTDATIVVGRTRPGETLVTLDGEKRPITPDMLMIRDARSPVAIAGVMGGRDSEVSTDSADILLECALFEPRQVRATRRALGMSTDASYRFERGVDPATMETAVLRAAALILATAGGTLDGEIIDAHPVPWKPPLVTLRPSRVSHVLGVDFAADALSGLLTPLGYEATDRGADTLEVAVPGHRSFDTLREVDLIEEVARTHGYDAFPEVMSAARPGTVPDHPLFQLEDRLRSLLAADGISEAQTPALGPARDGDVPLLNPMSRDESHLRRDRLPGLFTHVERNLARGVRDVRLFEIGTVFAPVPGSAPAESSRVAVVLTGARAPVHWSAEGDPMDVFDAGRVLDLVAGEAFPGARVVPAGQGGGGRDRAAASSAPGPLAAPSPFVQERCYELVTAAGELVGRGGEVRPGVMDLPPWAGAVVGVEVVLPAEPEPRPDVTARDLPDQPASRRDVAFLVPAGSAAGDVIRAARGGGGGLLEAVDVFDLYEGDDLPPATRSVALRLRFRARGRTLTDREVDKAYRRVLRKVKEETGVEPRS